MKKLLTVLLVIAVICTFSFGSAFAYMEQTGAYKAAASYDKLYNDSAYAAKTGEYGITEAYRTALVKSWTEVLNNVEVEAKYQTLSSAIDAYRISSTYYFTAEKATAKAAVEAALETFKAAKTAKEAKDAEVALVAKLSKLTKNGVNTASDYDLLTTTVANFATYTDGLDMSIGSQLGSADAVWYLLPGYGYVSATSIVKNGVATMTNIASDADEVILKSWFVDNGYRTTLSAKAQVAALKAALIPLNEANVKAIQAEYNAINSKFIAAAKAWTEGGQFALGTVDNLDLDALEALYAEAEAYELKYKVTNYDSLGVAVFANWGTVGTAQQYLEYAYYNQYASEIKSVDLTDKAAVVALMDKIDALGYNYDYVATNTDLTTGEAYVKLAAAYANFEKADVDAFTTAYGKTWKHVSENGDYYYFDATEENVNAMTGLRKAYDEVVNNYGYGDFANVGTVENPFAAADKVEAKLLAGEHNMNVAAQYDEKNDKLDNTKLQAYLNNATLSVKSTKLAAKKVKVQAKFDAEDYASIVGQFGTGYTMSYKFYFKAPGKSYKLTKTKDVNYITYTSKSLKAGKNYFKVGVVVKDADGKVVAEKLYNASNAAYRTIK